jgi:hypothetical protein
MQLRPTEYLVKLGISIGTLRNHIHHLDRKLGSHGRLEALVQALKRGLIESLERGSNVSFREARMAGEGCEFNWSAQHMLGLENATASACQINTSRN